jgi:hypothetical protein
MSVQLFAQPLLAVGDYTSFAELARPRTFDFITYGSGGTTLSYDAVARRYFADPTVRAPPRRSRSSIRTSISHRCA